jgi:ABC-2 type transport system ATP-binding protein
LPTLTASHLAKTFDRRVAVDDVSFALSPGEIFALLGPNGAGKTTTLRMLAGLIEPSAGTVEIGGTAMTGATAARLRKSIGFLTEAPGLWDRLTVRQNLTIYARLYGEAPAARAVDRALDLFDIRERAADRTAQLSKGLRQRVALARTLLHDPPIVLLDEPTSGLDPESARRVRELVVRLRDERRAVLLSTHNLDEVERIATRVAIMRQRLIAVDTPSALRSRLFGDRVRIAVVRDADRFGALLRSAGHADVTVDDGVVSVGLDEGASVPVLVRRLVEAGADIESVAPESPPLEDVYLRLLEDAPGRTLPDGESR